MVRRRYCCSILLAIGGATAHRPFGLVSSKSLVRWIPGGGVAGVARLLMGNRRSITSIPRGGSASSINNEEEENDEEEMEEDDEEDAEEEEEAEEVQTTLPEATTSKASTLPAEPIVLTIQTSCGSAVLDQLVELENVVPTRTIESVKASISKKMAAKPPPSTITLRFDGRLLANHELVQDIIKEAKEEEEEEQDESATAGTFTADGLVLTMDTIVPVDPKSLPELERKIPDLTAEELLQAYAANEAALYQMSLILDAAPRKVVGDEDEDAEQDPTEDNIVPQTDEPLPVNAVIRDRIARIRADLAATILATENANMLLADDLSPTARQKQIAKVEIKGQRVRHPERNVAVRGIVQRNLNINWFQTGRAIVVLVFFGLFGGRTALSRAILLICAPLLVILQLRPVKARLTQLLYTILWHPPSIVLSLLPVPQQAMLSMDFDAAMMTIYGDQIKYPIKTLNGEAPVTIDDDDENDADDQEEEEEEVDDFLDAIEDEEGVDDDNEDEDDSDEYYD